MSTASQNRCTTIMILHSGIHLHDNLIIGYQPRKAYLLLRTSAETIRTTAVGRSVAAHYIPLHTTPHRRTSYARRHVRRCGRTCSDRGVIFTRTHSPTLGTISTSSVDRGPCYGKCFRGFSFWNRCATPNPRKNSVKRATCCATLPKTVWMEVPVLLYVKQNIKYSWGIKS